MKFLLLSSLLALAHGVEVAPSKYEYAADDKFYVDKLDCDIFGTPDNSNQFAIWADHQEGIGNGDQRYVAISPDCTQGATYATKWEDFVPPSWMTFTYEAKNSYAYDLQWVITIDPSVSADPQYWETTYDAPEYGEGQLKEGKANFCVFFGLGDEYKPYGFRELDLTIYFKFNGGFKGTNFYTRAYDPKEGSTTKKYKAHVDECSGYDKSGDKVPYDDAPPTVVHYPGKVICVEVCPAGYDDPVYIDGISWLSIKEMPNKFGAENSEEDYPYPSLTTAPGGWTNIVSEYIAGAYYTKYVNVKCPEKDSTYEYAINAVNGACCQIEFLLPAKYYPQLISEYPNSSRFVVYGSGTFSCEGCVESFGQVDDTGYPERRRALQEAETGGEIQMNNELNILTNAGSEDSAAGSMAAGAAAAAAMGAALLI